MVKIIDYSHRHFRPKITDGLEELVLFPDSEFKKQGIPNSSIWIFNNPNYQPQIFENDVGCGMALGFISPVDVPQAAEKIAEFLDGKRILGRGNHFVDICTGFPESETQHMELLIHTHTTGEAERVPQTIEEARSRVEKASQFRLALYKQLVSVIGAKGSEQVHDWPHNTIETEDGRVIYRKGVIKVQPNKIHLLPSSIGSTIYGYSVLEASMLPYNSAPHGVGRRGPRGETKVSLADAASVRQYAYVPTRISNSSLRTEHPSCFNSTANIFELWGKHMVCLGDLRILAYIGKI